FLTPVLAAASLGDAACLRALLERGAEVNVQGGPFQASPLLCAATTGSEETVRLLLEHGANARAIDWAGHTPLVWARRRGETRIVDLLRRKAPLPQEERDAAEGGVRAQAHPSPPLPQGERGDIAKAVGRSLPLLQSSGVEFT